MLSSFGLLSQTGETGGGTRFGFSATCLTLPSLPQGCPTGAWR